MDRDLPKEPACAGSLGIISVTRCLAADAGRLRTFADLISCCWGDRSLGDRARLQAAVKRLRVRLARIAPTVRIEAVWGAGFRLVADLGRHRAAVK